MKKTHLLPAAFVLLVLSTCSSGIGQMMIDAGEMLADSGNTHAQTMPGRVLTADTDASRMESGLTELSGTSTAIVTGPFVLTALMDFYGGGTTTGDVFIWLVPEATGCTPAPPRLWELSDVTLQGFLVKQGQTLCARSGNNALMWGGYRPY